MKIKYIEGPDRVEMGTAGEFKKGEAREINDTLAEALLKKQTIKFVKVEERTARTKKED